MDLVEAIKNMDGLAFAFLVLVPGILLMLALGSDAYDRDWKEDEDGTIHEERGG